MPKANPVKEQVVFIKNDKVYDELCKSNKYFKSGIKKLEDYDYDLASLDKKEKISIIPAMNKMSEITHRYWLQRLEIKFSPRGHCDICNTLIDYHFPLRNEVTGKTIIVGSECVTKYNVRCEGYNTIAEIKKLVEDTKKRLTVIHAWELFQDSPEYKAVDKAMETLEAICNLRGNGYYSVQKLYPTDSARYADYKNRHLVKKYKRVEGNMIPKLRDNITNSQTIKTNYPNAVSVLKGEGMRYYSVGNDKKDRPNLTKLYNKLSKTLRKSSKTYKIKVPSGRKKKISLDVTIHFEPSCAVIDYTELRIAYKKATEKTLDHWKMSNALFNAKYKIKREVDRKHVTSSVKKLIRYYMYNKSVISKAMKDINDHMDNIYSIIDADLKAMDKKETKRIKGEERERIRAEKARIAQEKKEKLEENKKKIESMTEQIREYVQDKNEKAERIVSDHH